MTLSRSDLFHRNLALTKQHLLDVISSPERFDWIPNGAYVIGLPQDDRELFEANMKLAHRLALKKDGQPIILIPEVVKRRVTRSRVRARAT